MCIFVLCSFEQGIEIKGNLDKTVDALLPSIRKFMLNNGLDPMQLPDLYEYIFPDLVRKNEANKIFIPEFVKFHIK